MEWEVEPQQYGQTLANYIFQHAEGTFSMVGKSGSAHLAFAGMIPATLKWTDVKTNAEAQLLNHQELRFRRKAGD
ncbi:MAG: hypothetical protein ABI977_05245 [Acidobacteriota bacterium]